MSIDTPRNTRPGAPEPTLWDISVSGRRAVRLPEPGVPESEYPENLLRSREGEGAPHLPELSELDVVRHFTRLSQKNFSIDTNFYPLGSCTMKYNPKLNEAIASLDGFAGHHPLLRDEFSQGSLAVIHEVQEALKEIAGFEAVSVQPAAGAQGELSGILIIRAYHRSRGDLARTRILIPDSAHGTNPASVSMAGFEAVEIPSDAHGNVDLGVLRELCDERVAGLMITNPNTLGLFEKNIEEIVKAVHGCGGLVYGDGANLNAIMGVVRPGDLGIDVMHFNLHKTFSTPHGGGGPGAGPVGAAKKLVDFLPGPIVERAPSAAAEQRTARTSVGGTAEFDRAPRYRFVMPKQSIGRLKSFYGNFGMVLRAFAYIRSNGAEGLREVAENAVLNANYLKWLIREAFPAKYDRSCMHEFVVSGKIADGVETMDVAKRLLDYGFHAPTVYFPLIVKDAMMIEPTETENRETIEAFASALIEIAREALQAPELLHDAPLTTTVSRLDEVHAAKHPVLRAGESAR